MEEEIEELKKMTKAITKSDYAIFGRTQKAFISHPLEWQETERWVNHIFSLAINQEADVTAGSAGMSRRALEQIVQ